MHQKKIIIKGQLEAIVLKLLSEYESMYGYEITKKVKELTAGQMHITEGALYPLLHKLESEGAVITSLVNEGNRMRKYYSLTKEGHSKKSHALAELQNLIKTLTLLAKPIHPKIS